MAYGLPSRSLADAYQHGKQLPLFFLPANWPNLALDQINGRHGPELLLEVADITGAVLVPLRPGMPSTAVCWPGELARLDIGGFPSVQRA